MIQGEIIKTGSKDGISRAKMQTPEGLIIIESPGSCPWRVGEEVTLGKLYSNTGELNGIPVYRQNLDMKDESVKHVKEVALDRLDYLEAGIVMALVSQLGIPEDEVRILMTAMAAKHRKERDDI